MRFLPFLHFFDEFELELLEEFELELLDELELELLDEFEEEFEFELPITIAARATAVRALSALAVGGEAAAAGLAATVTTIPVAPSLVAYVFKRLSMEQPPVGS